MEDGRLEEPRSASESPTFGQDGSFRVDKPVGSATISPCGRDIALASSQGLHIIDLDSPWSPPRHLVYHTPWEVADVQWSPFAARDYWVVSTSNQNALVWNLNLPRRQAAVEHVLRAHTRAISDINFSAHYPDILATCAVDSFVHCWDLRHPARPALTFCDWFAGATQVKWNRTDSHILASSHDKFLRIWDDRKGATPLRSIEAHATKIYGIDWNRFKTMNLATCSLDKTIKFWDYTKESTEPEHVFQTPFPVWRARHTPFGEGILAMPQKGDNDLHLYDCRADASKDDGVFAKSSHVFEGHHDQVKEFLWRPRGDVTATMDDREYQLVSWGADRVLRLHEVNQDVLKLVGYHKGMEVKRTTGFTRKGAPYRSFRDSPVKDELGSELSNDVHFGPTMRLPAAIGSNRSSALTIDKKEVGHKSSTLRGKAQTSHDMDPLSWMRGVKIGKQNTLPSGLHQSVSTIMSPDLKAQPLWDRYDNLAEELTAMGAKFSKVKFGNVSMTQRVANFALSGPWGASRTSTIINVTMKFPREYPDGAGPSISVARSASVGDLAVEQISKDVETLASAFKDQGRSSLEAILRYLLGEKSLRDGIHSLRPYRYSDDTRLGQIEDLSSSEDDDEGLDGYGEYQSDIAEPIDPLVVINNAQNNVPLPKACGALWADNGVLVCFFPIKQEKEPSILGQSLRGGARNRNAMLEGFGKLHDDFGRRKGTAAALETMEDGQSDLDDYETSSSESFSSRGNSPHQHHFLPAMRWDNNGFDKSYNLFPNESLKSTGEIDTTNSPAPKARVRVSLHDLNSLIPAKQCLAKDYRIGSGYSNAVHNASVARRHGYTEVANVWSLIGLILQDKVPVRLIHHPQSDRSVVNVARSSALSTWNEDSGIDLSFDDEQAEQGLFMDHVSWGSHPFGRRWLVQALFHHYEQIADVQMLAMMSCIFCEPRETAYTEDKDSQKRAFSAERTSRSTYYPSFEVATSFSGASLQSSPRKQLGINSTSSSAGASVSDHFAISYEKNTPPGHIPLGMKNLRKDSQTTSLSTSPEHHRRFYRSNSNLSVMAASFARPFSMNNSAASSPPNSFPKKRVSPLGSYLGATPSSISWASNGMFGKASTLKEDSVTNISQSVSDTDIEPAPKPKNNLVQRSGFVTTFKNQRNFHNEGHAYLPLLDPSEENRFVAFREAYSELLSVWNLPIARSELLKYNDSFQPKKPQPDFDKTIPSLHGLSAESDTLALGVHCTYCTFFSEVGPSTESSCPNCTRALRPLSCLLCSTYIHDLASPCLHCGHTLHQSCRRAMAELGLEQCVSGCGCICSHHPVVEVPRPETRRRGNRNVRDVSPAVTIIADPAANERDSGALKDSGWEDLAYESLSRNLRRERRGSGRMLKGRVSQIWRGSLV